MSTPNTKTENPINWEKCLKSACNDEKMAREILSMFIKDLNEAIPIINQSWTQKNYSVLRSHIHKLHGGSYYTGVPTLSVILAELDKAMKKPEESDASIISPLMQSFENASKNLLNCYNANKF